MTLDYEPKDQKRADEPSLAVIRFLNSITILLVIWLMASIFVAPTHQRRTPQRIAAEWFVVATAVLSPAISIALVAISVQLRRNSQVLLLSIPLSVLYGLPTVMWFLRLVGLK